MAVCYGLTMVLIMFNPPVRRRFAGLILSCALLPLAGCSKPGGEAAASAAAKASVAIPVSVATAEILSVPYAVNAIGNVEPLASVALKSRVDGQITQVLVRDGQDVAKGQLMFQIDPRPFEIQLQQAEANRARDRAVLDNASAQEKRYRDLLAQNYISADGYAQVKANLDVAQANLQANEGAIENARLQMEFTRIRAPINGRLGKIQFARGNLAKANDANPLVVINQVDPIYVSFSIPEQVLPTLREAMTHGVLKVHALSGGDGVAAAAGDLTFVDNAVDAATGTIRLRATFRNSKSALWPGQYINVRLQLGQQNDALVIPAAAVQTGPKGAFVYTLAQDSTVVLRDITVTRTTPEGAVIQQGLSAGEKVVVDGQSRLRPGAAVMVKPVAGTS